MYTRRLPGEKYLNDEFISGVEKFIDFAKSHPTFMSRGNIRCPCSKCENGVFQGIEEVKEHLYRWGFVANYQHWTSHGEPYVDDVGLSNHAENLGTKGVKPYNPYRSMVLKAAGPSFNPNFHLDEEACPYFDEEPLNGEGHDPSNINA